MLKEFERWYEQQSPTDTALGDRLYPHITGGQLNPALREAWPLFKTRMVEAFGLTDDLDGHELANKLFGNNGATAGLLPNVEREGYLNLFRGLYALNRNPVSHNDLQANPEYAVAVLSFDQLDALAGWKRPVIDPMRREPMVIPRRMGV